MTSLFNRLGAEVIEAQRDDSQYIPTLLMETNVNITAVAYRVCLR
jgi:hypothetical protein